MSSRLDPQPGEQLDRSRALWFTWNGKPITGFAGDTIASALAANDIRILGRSMKYHRPRALMTADYWDPNARLQVGDEPNVRAAHRMLEAGMRVKAQNAWPSVEHDIKAANGLVSRFLGPGFYYKTFKNQSLWPAYERVLSTFAPGGTVNLESERGYYDKRYAHPDVVVAGGGPAGMSAALAAALDGASVMLVEHEYHLGGHLRWGDEADRHAAAELAVACHSHPNVEVLVNSTVTGRYEDNWVAINQRSHQLADERLIKARAKILVVAAGLIERPYVFDGNDRPGVMLSGGVRRLINLWAVKPGERAVVFTANAQGDAVLTDLERAGVEIAGFVDARAGVTVSSAHGSGKSLRSVTLSDGSRFDADLLVTATGWTAPTSLLNMAGDRPVYHPAGARFVPGGRVPDTVLATGGMIGDGTLDELVAHGRATGSLAAARADIIGARLQKATPRAVPLFSSIGELPPDERTPLPAPGHLELFRSDTHGIVDYSEDVSSKDLVAAAAEGYDSVELLKRYTTATMGPEQGKLETVNTVAVLAEALDSTIAEVGTTVWRPPFAPVSLGALGGRLFEPTRVSALQPWHEAREATPINAGQWIRPEHYGDPEAEVRHVRSAVGIMDVTPLGKFDLRGRHVPELLNLLYTNAWSKLEIGRVRYGVMCAEDGVVMDDGVTGRLADDHYLMTTTTSGAGSVGEWAENWLQTAHPDWDVVVTPVTSAYTSINVAGPRSRDLLARLTPMDLAPEAFPYMNVRVGTVARVANCVVWRIGFTGELSYEVHVPAGYGPHVWEALLEAGKTEPGGIRPFGLEAQRIMRLEKGHFIVGQDTDGLTKMPTTGLGSLVRLHKEDMAGKPELAWSMAAAATGKGPRLVALQPSIPTLVPDEACQIVRSGTNEIIGRVTSSRFSPTLERSICLGQVEASEAVPGAELTVVLTDGSRTGIKVMAEHAHYDPEGARLRV
ncbi:MAG: 2Fe-2S iron-sulfur cluster-binding protein [Actinomycetota bacterium]